MGKGCLLLLAVLVGGYFLEASALEERGFRYEWWIPLLLSLGGAITLTNLLGIFQILKQKRMASIPPTEWTDGQSIGVSGVLKAIRQPLVSPVSKQQALVYEYNIKSASGSGKNKSYRVRLAGFGMAPCAISTARGPIRLVGFPFMNQFSGREVDARSCAPQLAEYLSQTRFKKESSAVLSAIRQLREITGDDDGELKLDCAYGEPPFDVRYREEGVVGIQRTSITDTSAPDDDLTTEYFQIKLSNFEGRVDERVIPVDTEVTIFGTYRSNPMRIDIGNALSALDHGMFLGTLNRVLRSRAIAALALSLLFGAGTVYGHVVAYGMR